MSSFPATAELLSELPSRISTPSPAPPTALPSLALQKKLLKEQRKAEKDAKKDAKKAEVGVAVPQVVPERQSAPLRFLPREWGKVEPLEGEEVRGEGRKVSIMSWNMLAQALVRRELFPNSNFLKVKDRIPTLMQEFLHYAPDIACLQEVDRLSDHLPSLTLTHAYTSYIGYPNKSHGLLIAHKSSVFTKVGERGLRLDELPIDDSLPPLPSESPAPSDSSTPDTEESTTHDPSYDPSSPTAKLARQRAGLSRSTRNVALLVALKFKDREGGVIVGTTHLFWHPQHVYERARQTGILYREARRFRDEGGGGAWRDWPTFLAGDFNTQPREITYRLLMGLPLTPAQEGDLDRSTVVHQSVDKLHDPSFVPPPESEATKQADADGIRDGNLSQHPDKVIRNAREGGEGDGMVGLEEIKRLFGGGKEVRSAYGEGYGRVEGEQEQWYVERLPEVQSGSGWVIEESEEVKEKRRGGSWEERVRRGDFEPRFTNFTPLWRCTLDYIFLLPPSPLLPPSHPPVPAPRFTSLLRMHPVEAMGLGLPKKGVEPSDHVALAAEVEIF